MSSNPKESLSRITTIAKAWKTLRPNKSFGGMSLTQFTQTFVTPCEAARSTVADLEIQLTQAADIRDDADKKALTAVQLVVNGVRGDPAEGENGELYEAMGYVRKSERARGLTRRKLVAASK